MYTQKAMNAVRTSLGRAFSFRGRIFDLNKNRFKKHYPRINEKAKKLKVLKKRKEFYDLIRQRFLLSRCESVEINFPRQIKYVLENFTATDTIFVIHVKMNSWKKTRLIKKFTRLLCTFSIATLSCTL